SDVNPQRQGLAVTFSAHVTVVAPGAGRPSGSVTFQEGSTSLGTATVDATGSAQLTLSTLAAGSHSITATYGGDANFTTSTSSGLTVTVNAAIPTTVSLQSGANPSVYGQVVTLIAAVAGPSGSRQVPSGKINFTDGSLALGSGV